MLSTLALRYGLFDVLRSEASRRSWFILPASLRFKSNVAAQAEIWDKANKIFYGPERDTKNFSHPVMASESGKVRLGFIPEEWFQFFYSKTGVTGPYVFGIGLITTLLSKEIWVIDHGFSEVIGFGGAVFVLAKTVGPRLSKWAVTKNEQIAEEMFVKPVIDAKKSFEEIISTNEKAIWQEDGQKYLWDAKRENVALQLEALFRQRLHDVYREVKNRLDYQLETQNVKRRFEQEHMVNWIVSNVKKSISPQQEQEALKSCITTLKALAPK